MEDLYLKLGNKMTFTFEGYKVVTLGALNGLNCEAYDKFLKDFMELYCFIRKCENFNLFPLICCMLQRLIAAKLLLWGVSDWNFSE
ncbi:unnamed protein product [Enterobius vermicularis]|uniref:Uncharacterized protein n=1 Tax=Enterobius vermicularis TaxID=51028 RepID=A0A0N4V4Y4_ENTVE|nr:unnamed protein product [Enterobius vermicularis]